MTDTLLLLSGGIDSAFCLWQRVQAGLPTRTHHVGLYNREGRGGLETKAATRIVDWLSCNGGAGLIEHTQSVVDMAELDPPLDHHLWAYWVGAILAAPRGRDYRQVVIPRHVDAFHDGPADGPAAQASDAAYLGHIALMTPRVPELLFPLIGMSKADVVAAMPAGLLELCWWCRTPVAGRPCHRCYTCRLVDPALAARTEGDA